YVFRRAIFAELYELMAKMNKVVAFLLAGLISGVVFALAHWDFTHIIIYLAMSYTFSFVYLMTKRLIVPIMVHMLMNGIVVLLQVALKDQIEAIEKLQSVAQAIIHLF
ncbi:MAG TPA: CPBP family intramembrane glutamic endopeptidase, partial [Jeotgalicoccus sp.]|nr:CPBP family intramembrane glutamic endopeptidase [Jeotgalicoccus sp.]